ncbi:uncharacterized protein DFL_009168 [Arthrobotrys flagrans]|uniref:Uncharacterized protein n=1 Tax=Arthrobotrys flagrans TaxID=97331 RepID=A0A436ZQW1_ARTFL|nr:hypothetical protein DFL_009168 [Arthrobotrys flagrans]
MAPTTGANTTAAKSGPGRKKKPTTPTEPTRRSTRAVVPRTIFSSGVTKPKAAPKKRKTTVVKEKIVAAPKKAKATVTKKPGPKPSAKKTKTADAKSTKKTKTKA